MDGALILLLAVVPLSGNLNLKGCPEPGCDSVRTPQRVERLVEVPGFVRLRVTAEGAAPTVDVCTDDDGTTYADVGGTGVTRCGCELVDFVPTGAYMGCGWHVVAPGDFRLAANGHENATRYTGFDLPGGRSVVIATSLPPLELYHCAAQKVAGFRCDGPSRFALFPGRDGAFACALRSRRFFDALGEVAAPGVRAKADKFCVDSWNGSFREHAELIRRAAAYGVTNDVFMLAHCWQRHGFDRRLPDVWPPHPAFGTADEAKAAVAAAAACGWRYGVHLNTIDVYSNSTWFAWDKVCHDAQGRPIRAWRNPYSLEQSFRLLHGFAPASAAYQAGPVVGGTGVIARIPWFPLVNHDRMVPHGAGYSARFENGRGELCHGVDSDDYISCEMLAGNPPMADCYSRDARDAEALVYRPLDMDRSLRQVVRKYWLMQPVTRELAMARVTAVRFADGDPNRIVVDWSTGMTVKVNRGEADWATDGHVLPQYGYRAWNPKTGTESKVYRHATGRVVEESAGREGDGLVRYASARRTSVPRFTPVEPVSELTRTGNRVRVRTAWRPLSGTRAPNGAWRVSTCWGRPPSTGALRRGSSKPTGRASAMTVPTVRCGSGCCRRTGPLISDGRRRRTASAPPVRMDMSGRCPAGKEIGK